MADTNRKADALIAQDKVRNLGQSNRIHNYFDRAYRIRAVSGMLWLPFIVVGMTLVLYQLAKIPAEYSASTEATITGKSFTTPYNGQTRSSQAIATYTVQDQTYTAFSSNQLFNPPVGSKVTVSYLPSNPSQAKVHMKLKQILLLASLYIGVPCLITYIVWRILFVKYF